MGARGWFVQKEGSGALLFPRGSSAPAPGLWEYTPGDRVSTQCKLVTNRGGQRHVCQ